MKGLFEPIVLLEVACGESMYDMELVGEGRGDKLVEEREEGSPGLSSTLAFAKDWSKPAKTGLYRADMGRMSVAEGMRIALVCGSMGND